MGMDSQIEDPIQLVLKSRSQMCNKVTMGLIHMWKEDIKRDIYHTLYITKVVMGDISKYRYL